MDPHRRKELIYWRNKWVVKPYILPILLIIVIIFISALLIQEVIPTDSVTGSVIVKKNVEKPITINSNTKINLPTFTKINFSFLDFETFKTKIVVGDNANLDDIKSALILKNYFENYAENCKSKKSNDNLDIPMVNKYIGEIRIGDLISSFEEFGSPVTKAKIIDLYSGRFVIDLGNKSKTYAAHDSILLSLNPALKFGPQTALTGLFIDEDFKDKVYIPIARDVIQYQYTLEQPLEETNYFTSASETRPFKIFFLGKMLNIEGATANSITVDLGKEYRLAAGESVEFEGKIITLIQTSETSATIKVNENIEVLNEGSQKRIDGIKIRVEDISSEEGINYDAATLSIGDEAQKTFYSGDEYFNEDEDNPVWVWVLSDLNTATPTIGISWDLYLDEPEENDNSLYEHPIYLGESLCLPNNYACFTFEGIKNNDPFSQTYQIETAVIKDLYYSVEAVINNSNPDVVGAKTLNIEALNVPDDIGMLAQNNFTKNIYIWYNTNNPNRGLEICREEFVGGSAICFTNISSGTENSNAFLIANKFSIFPINITWNVTGDNSGKFVIDPKRGTSTDIGEDIILHFELDNNQEISYLGHSESDENTTGDLMYGSEKELSGFKEDVLHPSGIKLYGYKQFENEDMYKFTVPSNIDEFKALISLRVNFMDDIRKAKCNLSNVEIDLVKDSDFKFDQNAIFIGGPCINNATLKYFGLKCGDLGYNDTILSEIKNKNYRGILLAGYNKNSTLEAVNRFILNMSV